jgi:hypothetical protein
MISVLFAPSFFDDFFSKQLKWFVLKFSYEINLQFINYANQEKFLTLRLDSRRPNIN